MRTTFIDTLIELAEENPRIFLLTGDLGYSVVERFQKKFPDRFVNAGIAEQNMTGVAAGLALAGFHPFTYSIANFATLRCFEQIRNDIAYPNLSVTIVGVGLGTEYGSLGYSHHALEDVACMKTLPNMMIIQPKTLQEVRASVRTLVAVGVPSYLKLSKGTP